MLSALTGQRPRFSRDLDTPPKAGVRPFESLADLRRVAEELTRLTVRIALAEGLDVRLAGMQQVPEPRPHLDDHVRTAMVRVLAGGELAARAVTVTELGRAAATLVRGQLPTSARARVQSSVMALLDAEQSRSAGPHLLTLIDGWLAELTEVLTHLDPADVDPRFVTGVLVASVGARA